MDGVGSQGINAFEDVENGDSKLSDFSIDDLQHCFSCEGDFIFSHFRVLTFYSAQVIPHHPGASAIDIWAKCISEGQLQESFFNQFQPAVLLYWYQINSSMLTVNVSET